MTRDHAVPFVECCIEIFEAYHTKRLPNYNKLYDILNKHLYPKGKETIVFDHLSNEQKAAAKKELIVPITEVPNPVQVHA